MPAGMMPEPPGSEADEANARGHRTRSHSAEVIGRASFHDGTGIDYANSKSRQLSQKIRLRMEFVPINRGIARK